MNYAYGIGAYPGRLIVCAVSCALFSLFITNCTNSSQIASITESDIRTIIKEIESANINKDINGIEKYLAPFVIIDVEMETREGIRNIQLTKEEYISQLKKTFARTTKYEYGLKDTAITVTPDGKRATVKTDVIERIVASGRESGTITHEDVVYEIIDGKILVTVLNAQVRNIPAAPATPRTL